MATVVFQATPGGIDVDGEEEIRLRRRAQLYIDDNGLDSTGELVISTKRIAWQAEGAQQGFSLAYQSIVMHAVSRDTSSFHSPCLYLQIDAEHKISGSRAGANTISSNGTSVPMDLSDGGGAAAAVADGATKEEDESEDDEDEEAPQELRLVPVGAETDGAGIDVAIDRLFDALSACAALNPDPDDSEDEDEGTFAGEFEGEDGAVLGIEGFEAGDDPQAMLAGASPAQLAMLARFDAMLEAQESGHPSGGMAAPQNDDGRFDDAEDEEAARAERAPAERR